MKTRKESKYTTTGESLSTTIARTEQLRKILTDQRAKRDGYAALLSKELVGNIFLFKLAIPLYWMSLGIVMKHSLVVLHCYWIT